MERWNDIFLETYPSERPGNAQSDRLAPCPWKGSPARQCIGKTSFHRSLVPLGPQPRRKPTLLPGTKPGTKPGTRRVNRQKGSKRCQIAEFVRGFSKVCFGMIPGDSASPMPDSKPRKNLIIRALAGKRSPCECFRSTKAYRYQSTRGRYTGSQDRRRSAQPRILSTKAYRYRRYPSSGQSGAGLPMLSRSLLRYHVHRTVAGRRRRNTRSTP